MKPTDFTARWSDDIAQADWFIPKLHPFEAYDVGSVIPEGFDAYCRIFHPARWVTPDGWVKARWREVAARAGRTVHPTMQFHAIQDPAPGQPAWSDRELSEPWAGGMARDELEVLTEHLRKATTLPDKCWFCVWEGSGELQGGGGVLTHQSPGRPIRFDGTHIRLGGRALSIPYLTDRFVSDRRRHAREEWRRATENPPPDYDKGPRVEIPNRRYFLYKGSVDEAIVLDKGSDQPLTANMWWPEDRSWFVSTEIDFCWTFVGARQEVIDAILSDDRLEALPIRLTDQVTEDADEINR